MNLRIKIKETCKQLDNYELRYVFTKLTNISCHENDLSLCCNLIYSLPATKCTCLLYVSSAVNAKLKDLKWDKNNLQIFCSIALSRGLTFHWRFLQLWKQSKYRRNYYANKCQAVIIDKLWVCDTDAKNSTMENRYQTVF